MSRGVNFLFNDFTWFYFLLVFFFFNGLSWNFDHVDHQAKSTALIISLAWITCCYLKNRGVKKAQQDSIYSWSSNAWTIATQI